MEHQTTQKGQDGWSRIEPGEVILLAFAMSLMVALVSGITSGVLSTYFPTVDVSVLKAIGLVALFVFVALACIIGCAAD